MRSSPGPFRWLTLLLAVVACAALVAPRRARASELAARVVFIEVAGPTHVIAAMRTTAAEVLGRLDVTPIVEPEGNAPPAGSSPWVRAHVELLDLQKPRLVVMDGATGRELARRTLPAASSVETAVESAALVLYMVLESSLSGTLEPEKDAGPEPAMPRARPGSVPPRAERATGRRPAETSVGTKEPADEGALDSRSAATPRSAATLALHAGALARLAMLDRSRAIAGGGLLAGIRPSERVGALMYASVHFPSELTSSEAAAAFTVFSSRLLVTLDVPIVARAAGVFGAGGGVDWLTADVSRAPAGAVAPRSISTLDGVLTALLGLRLELGESLLLTTAAGVDIDPSPQAFVGRAGGQRTTLLELAPVRPSVLIALSFTAEAARGGAR